MKCITEAITTPMRHFKDASHVDEFYATGSANKELATRAAKILNYRSALLGHVCSLKAKLHLYRFETGVYAMLIIDLIC